MISLFKSSSKIALSLLLSVAVAGLGRSQSTDAPNGTDSKALSGPILHNTVLLPVSVVDKKKNLVTDLEAKDFVVFEDGQQQKISYFSREDTPVSIGILMDDSGSMRSKREEAAQMVVELLRAANPSDEFFVVHFNDQSYMDQDFTSDLTRIQSGLARGKARAGTALYDSLLATSDHLVEAGRHFKKVLVVVSDGDDNESRSKFPGVIREFQIQNRPAVYAIGLLKDEPGPGPGRARHALETLAAETGGLALFPKNSKEMHEAALRIAEQIRNQYTIGYVSPASGESGQYRKLRIAADRKDITIHARLGYMPGLTTPQRK